MAQPAAPPLSKPPIVLGCYHDHDPNAGSLAGGEKYIGTRLLKYGMPKCSGAWGCGDGPKNVHGCPTWPSALDSCDRTKMTPEYCATMCHAWDPSLIYAGCGGSGDECWCSPSLNTDGGNEPEPNEKACNNPCKGDATEMCGGHFLISLVATSEPDTWAWVFVAVLLLSLAAYAGGGVMLARRSGGGRGQGLKVHPHYGRWVELAGLVSDGVAFARGQSSGNRQGHGGKSAAFTGGSGDGKGARQAKKQKKQKKESKEKQGKEGSLKEPLSPLPSGQSGSSGAAVRAAVPSAAAPPATTATAAGDGGRWCAKTAVLTFICCYAVCMDVHAWMRDGCGLLCARRVHVPT